MAKTSPTPEERGARVEWCLKCDEQRSFLPFAPPGKGYFCNSCGGSLGSKTPEFTAISGVDEYEWKGQHIRTLVIGHLDGKGGFVFEREIVSKWRS